MARTPTELDGQEAFPEADRLFDFPHPRHTETVYGHDGAVAAFEHAFDQGRMHHAWLLNGPAGIGKATFTYQIAQRLLEDGDAGHGDATATHTNRLIAGLAHPRLMLIRRPYDQKTKKLAATIPVDEVRKLRPFVSKTADSGAWRVVIIDNANDLAHAAANALLKVLEEPPRQTVFLLVAPRPGALLATIRSRCRTLSFSPLASTPFAQALNQAMSARDEGTPIAFNPARIMQLERLAHGSVGRALVLADHNGEALMARINQLFDALPNVDWPHIRAFVDEVSGSGQDRQYRLAVDLILQRITALTKARASGIGSEDDVRLAKRLIAPDSVASWAELWETLANEVDATLRLNLDRAALILTVFSRLAHVTAKT